MRIAHLSDLHFGRHEVELADSLSADVCGQKPDLVVISGDFAQTGSRREFAEAAEFLKTLEVPYMAVPGNHDVPMFNLWRRFTNPYGYYREYISEELEPTIVTDNVVLAGLKTARRAQWGLNWSDGAISRDQLKALERRFDEAGKDKLRIVVAHHPLMHPDEEMQKHQAIVHRANRALQTFARLNVRLVLSGHFHMSYVRRYGAPGSIAQAEPDGPRQSTAGQLLVAQSASTISTRLRGHPNAYNLIDIEDDTITIRVREWLSESWATREGTLVGV